MYIYIYKFIYCNRSHFHSLGKQRSEAEINFAKTVKMVLNKNSSVQNRKNIVTKTGYTEPPYRFFEEPQNLVLFLANQTKTGSPVTFVFILQSKVTERTCMLFNIY